jgi:ketosteroid isomerase-like protein
MKTKYIVFLLLVISITLFSCENTQEKGQKKFNDQQEQGNTSLREKIDKINQEIEKLMLKGDYDAILPYYANDIIISPAMQPSVVGIEAIKEIYREDKKIGLKHHSFSGNIKELWECSDRVYERGTFGLSLSTNDHPKPVAYHGSYFTIWQKEKDDNLKIKYLIYNLDFNPYK